MLSSSSYAEAKTCSEEYLQPTSPFPREPRKYVKSS
jgi:hypothetical protein